MKPLLFPVAGFFLGLIVAFSIKLGAPQHAQKIAPDRPRFSSSPEGKFLDEFSRPQTPTQHAEALEKLPAEKIPALLSELRKNASRLSGLESSDRYLFEDLVCAWHKKAPDDVLEWLKKQTPSDRSEIFTKLAGELAKTDLDGAMELLRIEQAMGMDDDGLRIPREVIEKGAERSAQKLLEICRLSQLPGRSYFSPDLAYPKDFDFKLILEGKEADEVAKKPRFRTWPINLIKEWAKRDPQAAWDWLSQSGKKRNKDEFFRVATSGLFPEEKLGKMLAGSLDTEKKTSDRYDDIRYLLQFRLSSELAEAFLQAAPGERMTHLDSLFENATHWRGGDIEKLRKMLFEKMTPEQQTETCKRYANILSISEEETLGKLKTGQVFVRN